MFASFFLSANYALIAWSGLVVLLIGISIQTYVSVLLNRWYESFYSILQLAPKSSLEDFYQSFIDFGIYACVYMLIATATAYLSRRYCFSWRKAITFAYLALYDKNIHKIEGSSQRIQEDCYNFAKITERLGISVIKAIFTLIAFLPILYDAAKGLVLPIFSSEFALIYWALIASIGGLIISWLVGAKLPSLEYSNQKAEAAFRKELVLAEDDSNYGSSESLLELFSGISLNYRRLFLHYGYFDVWINVYEQFMVIFAFLLIGSNLFSGAIALGALMAIDNAFDKVRSSFSVLTSNWTSITELRSIYKRLKEFQNLIGY